MTIENRLLEFGQVATSEVRILRSRLDVIETAGFDVYQAKVAMDALVNDIELAHARVVESLAPRGPVPPPMRNPAKEQEVTWASRFKQFHLWATVFWALMVYPTIVYWKSSIEYLVFISVYAIIISHIEAWQTARLERNAEKKDQAG